MATLKNTTINDTGFITLPSGTIAQRPASPTQGMMRYNSDLLRTEVYNGSLWIDPASNAPVDGAVVTSNLMLHYDFGNQDSYYPSRNIVYDISGNGRNGRFGFPTINLLSNPTQVFNASEFYQYYDLRPIFENNGLVPYSLSMDMKANINGSVLWYMQNGSYTKYGFVSSSVNVTTAYQRFKFENITPSGPNSAWLQNTPSDNRAMLATYTGYGTGCNPVVTNIQLELGTYSTNFVDGQRNNPLSWSSSNGGSLTFNGLNDHINCGSLNLQQNFTLEVWARMTSNTNFGIFGQGPTTTNQGLHCLYQTGGRGMVFGMYANDNDYNNFVPTINAWYHWVYTYNHSTFAKLFYSNGVLQTPTSSTQNQYAGSGQFNIGSIYSNPIYISAVGNIAIARVYNTVLSQAQITQNFNAQRSRFGV